MTEEFLGSLPPTLITLMGDGEIKVQNKEDYERLHGDDSLFYLIAGAGLIYFLIKKRIIKI
jgi:hypothetical protein